MYLIKISKHLLFNFAMLKDIIKNEQDLLATLITIRDLINEHNIFVLKGMVAQLNKLIISSEQAISIMTNYNNHNDLGDKNGETNQPTT